MKETGREFDVFPVDADPIDLKPIDLKKEGHTLTHIAEIEESVPSRKRLNQTSFEVDAVTRAALNELKKVYSVSSNAAVMKRAVRIALIASRFSDANKDLHLLAQEEGSKREVVVPQLY